MAPDVTEAVVKMEILLFTGKEKLKDTKKAASKNYRPKPKCESG